MKIWVNTIVHNEENFIWFAVMSVVDFVDKVLIYDTGSTDRTVEIINEIRQLKKDKIIFKEVGLVDDQGFTKLRQQMLEQSKCDWIILVDGDEIWWDNSIKKVINTINQKGQEIEGIVVPFIVNLGDIYHYQEQAAGQYQLLGKKGHLNLRAINKSIPGLHVDLPYGKEGYFDHDNKPVQERKKIIFLDTPYLHTTHLKRSSKQQRNNKYKLELGSNFKKNFPLPEILSKPRPMIIPSPFIKRSKLFWLTALPLTPLRKIKRRLTGGK